jgi:hypothetical protein
LFHHQPQAQHPKSFSYPQERRPITPSFGTKRTYRGKLAMSAFERKADINQRSADNAPLRRGFCFRQRTSVVLRQHSGGIACCRGNRPPPPELAICGSPKTLPSAIHLAPLRRGSSFWNDSSRPELSCCGSNEASKEGFRETGMILKPRPPRTGLFSIPTWPQGTRARTH